MGSLPTSSVRAPDPPSEEEKQDSDLDDMTDKKEKAKEKEEKSESSSSSRRRATSRPEFKDEMVSCPECGFQCLPPRSSLI